MTQHYMTIIETDTKFLSTATEYKIVRIYKSDSNWTWPEHRSKMYTTQESGEELVHKMGPLTKEGLMKALMDENLTV